MKVTSGTKNIKNIIKYLQKEINIFAEEDSISHEEHINYLVESVKKVDSSVQLTPVEREYCLSALNNQLERVLNKPTRHPDAREIASIYKAIDAVECDRTYTVPDKYDHKKSCKETQ